VADDDKEKDEKDTKPAESAEGAVEGEAAPAKKDLSKKMVLIIAAAAVLVLGGGGGAAFFLMHGKSEKNAEETKATTKEEDKGKGSYFQLGDMLVNLSGEGKHPNFLKVKVTLELADAKDAPMMEAIKPRIIDNFQVYLRELRIEDLRGSAGMYRLREELLARVTEAASPIRVRDVLLQEMLVQ
jgi:flagellar FliL protein